MGSVCDLRKRSTVKTDEVGDLYAPNTTPANTAKADQQVRSQKSQLDDLLKGVDALNGAITTLEQYAAVREQLAFLRAFRSVVRCS